MQKSIKSKDRENLFSKIVDYFPNLTRWASKHKRDLKPQIDMTREEPLQDTSQSRHSKGKTKMIQLKLQEENTNPQIQTHGNYSSEHPTESLKARGVDSCILLPNRCLDPAKVSFKIDQEIRMFQNKQELKQHLITSPAVMSLFHRIETIPPGGERGAGS